MTQPIRALLLAAGFGTRLKPLTLTTPKCLVPIGGQPLLERWLQSLEACGCSDALVNTHYLADQVDAFLEERPKGTMHVQSVYEPELLGTAGTLLANQSFFEGSTGLLIHADNATDFNLKELIQAHQQRPKSCLLTMLTFETDKPQSCGIVEIDNQGIVQAFHEKVDNPPGNRANGAVYAFNRDFLEATNAAKPKPGDFSIDILPSVVGKIFTCEATGRFIDIGSPEALKKARSLWQSSGETRKAKSINPDTERLLN